MYGVWYMLVRHVKCSRLVVCDSCGVASCNVVCCGVCAYVWDWPCDAFDTGCLQLVISKCCSGPSIANHIQDACWLLLLRNYHSATVGELFSFPYRGVGWPNGVVRLQCEFDGVGLGWVSRVGVGEGG